MSKIYLSPVIPSSLMGCKTGGILRNIRRSLFYKQIFGEILEAQEELYNHSDEEEILKLSDVITLCVTRLDIMGLYDECLKFAEEMDKTLDESNGSDEIQRISEADADEFYFHLTRRVMMAHENSARGRKDAEEKSLQKAIALCLVRLRAKGLDSNKRHELFADIDYRNLRLGYLYAF